MRIQITILVLLSAISFNHISKGQTVSLPDTNFINYLKEEHREVINADNELILSKADDITYLDISGHNIHNVEGIQYFESLKTLNISENNIENLPDLSPLNDLRKLIARDNNLVTPPELSYNKNLEVIDLSDNNLTKAPVISGLNNLKKVDISENYLTFKDLLSLSEAYSKYIIDIYPQKDIPLEDLVVYRSKDTLILSTGIDTSINGITYTWFKNGNRLFTSAKDSFIIDRDYSKHEDTYYVQINHINFPITLETTEHTVSARTCLDSTAIEIDKTPVNCLNQGNVTVSYTENKKGQITYTLFDINNNEVYKNTTGSFNEIPASDYKLILEYDNLCKLEYPSEIEVKSKACKEVYITPDQDQNKDEYYFEEQSGRVQIYNKAGKLVRNLSLPDAWEGKNNHGELVSPGYYVANVNEGEKFVMISVIY